MILETAYRNHLRYPIGRNLARWDDKPGIAPPEVGEMTFTYAVIADGGIILCADSQVTHTHSDQFGNVIGTYEGRRGKIVRVGGRFAFSICGNAGLVDRLLAEPRAEQADSFEDVVRGYQRAFVQVLDKYYADGAGRVQIQYSGVAFLFCGFVGHGSARVPEIVKLDIRDGFLWNPIPRSGYAATGSERHGAAWYLHHRFYRDGIALEQAKLLAYCIAAEVADLDNSVGGPIEMEVITAAGSSPVTNLEKYERARSELTAAMRSFLAGF